MAATLTVVTTTVTGNLRRISGTFSAAAGENTASYSGFDLVTNYAFNFDGVIQGQTAKAVYSNPTITWTFDDLPATTTGTWMVEGR